MEAKIAERKIRLVGIEVPGIGRQLHRRADLVPENVDSVEVVGQTREVLVIGEIALPPAVDPVVHVGRTCHEPKGDRVAADRQPFFGIAAGQREGRRRRGERRLDDGFVDADHQVLAVDDCARLLEQRHRLFAHNANADFGEDAHRIAVKGLNTLLVEKLHRGIGVDDLLPWQLRDTIAAPDCSRSSSAAASAAHRELPFIP